MNFDDLKNSWQQRESPLASGRFDELAARVQTRTAWFERTILRRDLIETTVAILVSLFFGFFLLKNAFSWVANLGIVIIILGSIELTIVMHWTRRRGGQPQRDLPLSDYCYAQLERVERQVRLLRNINWWYSGPVLLGACVLFLGILTSAPEVWFISLPVFGVFLIAVLYIGWRVYAVNQRAVREELEPLREELITIRQTLLTEPPSSGDEPN